MVEPQPERRWAMSRGLLTEFATCYLPRQEFQSRKPSHLRRGRAEPKVVFCKDLQSGGEKSQPAISAWVNICIGLPLDRADGSVTEFAFDCI
jgi:hypothetical protein